MSAEKFGHLKRSLVGKVCNVWMDCWDSVLNSLFYLPCGGESCFRRRCVKFASLTFRDRILDVCCGTGKLTDVIAKQGAAGQVVGVDISKSALEKARARTHHIAVTFLRASANNLPFASSQFNKCFISFGLHHMPQRDRQRTLKDIRRILVPGGALFVIDYNLPERRLRRLIATAFAKLDESEEAYKMLIGGCLIREIKQAGFEIKRQDLTCQGMIQLLEAVNK